MESLFLCRPKLKNDHNMIKRQLLLLTFLIHAMLITFGQVTTSEISGSVMGTANAPLQGATVKAIHVPTGSVYTTRTVADGQFHLANMRVGGPYKIEITYVGYSTKTFTDIFLQLGTPLNLSVPLETSSQELGQVTVSARKRSALISPERMGPSTNISQVQLQTLPSVLRSVDDFTRLVPQAVSYRSSTDGSTLGTSFGGLSYKYNQFTIDGANATDVFGLAATGTNGGQASLNPIPFDAIEQVQIILAPYDVTLSGFTGGGVNAVTRSGTNQLQGSVFGFNQNQSFIGNAPITGAKYGTFKDWNYGARLGGAIIQNKLFFFADYEGERKTVPVQNMPGTVASKVRVSALDSLSAFLKDATKHPGWSYDPGAYSGFNKEKKSDAFFARIDYNINEHNKLTVRHSLTTGSNYLITDGTSSASFYNNGYEFKSTTNSTVAELNTNFSNKTDNMLRLTYTATRDKRTTPGALFPAVKISDAGATYTFGTDVSSQANSLNQDNFTITDNFDIYAGKHKITFGTEDEFYHSANVFFANGVAGSYSYSHLADFYNDVNGVTTAYPGTYGISYSTDPKNPRPVYNVHADQFSLYIQDAFSITNYFKLTYGIRADMPVLIGKPPANATFDGSTIAQQNHVSTEQVPNATVLASPRIGFNWDVTHDHKTQLRGGAGIFTGRTPFVWLSNQYSNTGIGFVNALLNTSTLVKAANIHFNPTNPQQPTTGAAVINVIDKKFKYPRTFRANLAIDEQLPFGIVGTLEGIYTKTLEDINYKDLNLAPPTTTMILGNLTRPFYGTVNNPSFANIIELGNTNKGYAYSVTASLTRPFSNGWMASVAYTLAHSYALNNGTSSVALSNWAFAYNNNGLNNLDLGKSNYDPGSKIVAYVGKSFHYAKIFTTDLGLVYIGQSGQPLSYVMYGDLNGDAGTVRSATNPTANFYPNTGTYASADLMYLPSDASQFVNASQFTSFQQYENSTKYLRKHIGQNTEINGDRLPFENHFDLKVAESIALYKQHKLTISADILNVSNLLSKNWGRSYYQAYQEAQPLDIDHFAVQSNGQIKPIFTYNPTYGLNAQTQKPYGFSDYGSRWSLQVGLRYSF